MDLVMAARVLGKTRRSSGFTLIEMLVVLVLLSLLFLVVARSLQFATDADRKSAHDDPDFIRIRVQMFLASLLEQARPVLVLDPKSMTGESVAFTGTASRIDLMTSAPFAVAPGGVYKVSLLFDQTNQELATSWALFRPTGVTSERKLNLLNHVSEVEFGYFGEMQHQIGWHTSWEHALSLPVLIRIRLRFSGDKSGWQEFLLSPKINSDRPTQPNNGA